MGRIRNIESHDFYCINCGKKGLVLPRQKSHKHKGFHRKKLYCFYCKKEVNMIECKDEFEVEEFLENYANGVYKDEAEESVYYCGGSSIGQK